MFALLAVVSPSLQQIGALNLGPAVALGWVLASWAWLSVEAGLCEEFLFRACLQSRLSAWLKSPTAGIALTSILFGLAHWPGLYLRGGPDVDGWSTDPIQVAAFTVATLSPLAVSMGLLWARSRSLLLIVLVHGAIDALPHTAETSASGDRRLRSPRAGIWCTPTSRLSAQPKGNAMKHVALPCRCSAWRPAAPNPK